MRNTRQHEEDFKLEFHFNEEGLFINGNKRGLSSLAEELQQAAESETGYHQHLNFSWEDRQRRGKFSINFEWIRQRLRLRSKDVESFDVTIIKTDKIGKELWGE